MKNIYLNLPIRSVTETDQFFQALGLEKNEQFSSGDTTNAVLNNGLFLILMEDERFATFVGSVPSRENNNLTIALEFSTKEEVDEFQQKAIAAGASDTSKPPSESEGFLYGKSFRDMNGHIWELFTFVG